MSERSKSTRELYPGDLCKKKKSCHYGKSLGHAEGAWWYCDFLLMTGSPRNHDPQKCPYYKPKKKGAKKIWLFD